MTIGLQWILLIMSCLSLAGLGLSGFLVSRAQNYRAKRDARLALVVTPVACLHHHVAGYDPIEEAFELGGTVANLVFGADGWLHVAESNAKRLLHDSLLDLCPAD